MPAASISSFVDERTVQKFKILARSDNNVEDVADVRITPRLSSLSMNAHSNFTSENYAQNSRKMDAIQEKQPERHHILTQSL